jgi:hypothetical protein
MSSVSDFSRWTISPSMSISPNSFSMTTIFFPWFCVKMWFNNVVFPLPRNPVKTVIGILSSSFLFDELLLFALLSSVCCSCSLVAARADRRLPPPPPRALFKEANVLLSGGHILSSFFLDALETRGASQERKKEAPPLAPNTTSDAALIFFRF